MLNLRGRQLLQLGDCRRNVKYLVNVVQEKGYVEEQMFKAEETGLFYKRLQQTNLYDANSTLDDKKYFDQSLAGT